MYAAAGGASLASRQKRKNQAAQNVKNKALLQQGLKEKLAARASVLAAQATKAQQSRQFHNLPSTYLRTPQTKVRKLSAGYTAAHSSRLLLPINESNHQSHCPPTPHHHHIHHANHQLCTPFHHQNQSSHDHNDQTVKSPITDLQKRNLTKSATASIPLVSHYESTPPTSPNIPQQPIVLHAKDDQSLVPTTTTTATTTNSTQPIHIQVPTDSIIVTPATPLASPGPPQPNQLERKCSFYRERNLNVFDDNNVNKPPENDYYDQSEPPKYNTINKQWPLIDGCPGEYIYCGGDTDNRHIGVCICDNIECAQGRAAWQERGRRCSVQENSASYHRRWVKRNRIHDSSLAGSSDDEDLLGVLRGPSSFANAFLYVGLGTVAIGLVIAFVGTGEKGFKTVELRLIGPSLIGIGVICCILRIFFCICPSKCFPSAHRKLKKSHQKQEADYTTSLLRGDSKRVAITSGQKNRTHTRNINEEDMECLRRIASTTLFLQNEQKSTSNKVAPMIEKSKPIEEETPLEMQKINSEAMKPIDETNIEVCSITDDENESVFQQIESTITTNNQQKPSPITNNYNNQSQPSKLVRTRAPVNQPKNVNNIDSTTSLMETSLSNNQQSAANPSTQISYHRDIVHCPSNTFDLFQSSILHTDEPIPSTSVMQATELVLSPAKLGQ